jgi:hypothetical protein
LLSDCFYVFFMRGTAFAMEYAHDRRNRNESNNGYKPLQESAMKKLANAVDATILLTAAISSGFAALPNPGMQIDKGRTALVVTDPQNDFLGPKGVTWGVVGRSFDRQLPLVHTSQVVAAHQGTRLRGDRYLLRLGDDRAVGTAHATADIHRRSAHRWLRRTLEDESARQAGSGPLHH